MEKEQEEWGIYESETLIKRLGKLNVRAAFETIDKYKKETGNTHHSLSKIKFQDWDKSKKIEYIQGKIKSYVDEVSHMAKSGWKPIQNGPKMYQNEIEWLLDIPSEIKSHFSEEEIIQFENVERQLENFKRILKERAGSNGMFYSHIPLEIGTLEWLVSNKAIEDITSTKKRK